MDTNNQMGYKKYKVVLNENGKKGLKIIDSYDMQMQRLEENDDTWGGGKNRSKKNQTRRRKNKK